VDLKGLKGGGRREGGRDEQRLGGHRGWEWGGRQVEEVERDRRADRGDMMGLHGVELKTLRRRPKFEVAVCW
jgi:hypothetical protein